MQELYHKKIMDHYHASPYRGQINNPDFTTDATSPSCGDRIIFTGSCSESTLTDLKFEGDGSIIGQAAASMLCERVIGHSFDEILALTTDDLMQLLGIELGPTRKRTVTFVLETLQNAVRTTHVEPT